MIYKVVYKVVVYPKIEIIGIPHINNNSTEFLKIIILEDIHNTNQVYTMVDNQNKICIIKNINRPLCNIQKNK
jgi:hypothetical protein